MVLPVEAHMTAVEPSSMALCHSHHHAAVFERAGGVAALQLEVKFARTGQFLKPGRPDQRRVTLAQSEDGVLGVDGQIFPVFS
jgi:hypothetical protein